MQEEVTRREVVAVDAEQQKQNIQQELLQLRQNSDHQIKSKVKLIEEAEYNRKKVEEEIRLIRLQLESTEKQRAGAETELQELRARAEDAERQKRQAQEEAERLRRQVKEESQKKREAEEELKRKVQAERDAWRTWRSCGCRRRRPSGACGRRRPRRSGRSWWPRRWPSAAPRPSCRASACPSPRRRRS
ncbi:PLEC protein, partial [Todus mexicanus]|nr:PLEC protein [Todus mexicanus]